MDSLLKLVLWFYVLIGFTAGLNWWLRFSEVPYETTMRQINIGMLAFIILEIERSKRI